MERKKRSKGRGWESCYVKKNYGTFGVEMRSYGQKLVKLCTHTHTHTRVSYSSIDTAKCGRRNAEVRVASMGVALTGSLALAAEPTFPNVFRLPVNKSVPKNKVTLH